MEREFTVDLLIFVDEYVYFLNISLIRPISIYATNYSLLRTGVQNTFVRTLAHGDVAAR
jgi:hypothetical protein